MRRQRRQRGCSSPRLARYHLGAYGRTSAGGWGCSGASNTVREIYWAPIARVGRIRTGAPSSGVRPRRLLLLLSHPLARPDRSAGGQKLTSNSATCAASLPYGMHWAIKRSGQELGGPADAEGWQYARGFDSYRERFDAYRASPTRSSWVRRR